MALDRRAAVIPASELARRLCVSEHPYRSTTLQPVPCAQHLQDARRLHILTTPAGTDILRTILDVRAERGVTDEPTRVVHP